MVDDHLAVMEAFEAAHPGITIDITGMSNEMLHQNLQISAINDTLPHFWFQWGGELGGRYARYVVVRDLTDFAADNNWDQKFSAASLQLSTLYGQLAGWPQSLLALGVYYHRDIFADLGLSAPTTMDEFHHVVETIAAAGITPFATKSVPGWHIMRIQEAFLEYYAGPEQHDQLQVLEIPWEGNAAVINAFGTFQRYALSGFFPEGFLGMEYGDLRILFYPGHAAMMLEGSWFDNGIINDGQDLSRFGTFPFPSGRISAFVDFFQISDSVTDAEFNAIVAYLEFFYANHQPTPSALQAAEIPPQFVNSREIIASASRLGTFTITDQALPPIVLDALFAVQDYLAMEQMTPEEAASHMQRAIERHLAER
jgi:raffinose/stachyose/melibiose transport system substrate-binding protein